MDLAGAFQRLATTINETVRGQYEFKPPPFKGTPKEDIDTFLTKYDRFCELYNKDEDARLQIFPFFLQDKAYDIYVTFSDDIKNDYAQLTDELRLHFGQSELPIIESTRLYELTMDTTDTITTFHDTIQKRCKRLDITGHQKMVLFINGSPPPPPPPISNNSCFYRAPRTSRKHFALPKPKNPLVGTSKIPKTPVTNVNRYSRWCRQTKEISFTYTLGQYFRFTPNSISPTSEMHLINS